jgi:hypothetical protein
LKIAKVIPLFKGGDKSDISNYRPISILSIFSKILERIMFNRVFNYFSLNNLLYNNQFGFKKNNSTEHAIIQLVREISNSFEKSQFTLGIFIDLSKAFDTVDHDILLYKLNYYGINERVSKWFQSYLSNRKQFVSCNDLNHTQFLNVSCGVPQGSILGPLLFLIYINDLHKASNLLSIMFADDINLFLSNSDIYLLFSVMNKELQNISKWFKSNKLTLNVNKTKWIFFHPLSKKRSLPQNLPKIFIDHNEIKRDSVTKYLGVFIDENITWKHHINYVCSKVSKSIGILYKARTHLDKNNLTKLYYSFIHSYISYGIIAWGSTDQSKLQCLHRRQKHAIRVINFADRFSNSSIFFNQMKILNVYKLNVYKNLSFVYMWKYDLSPLIFKDLFILKPLSKFNMRNNNYLNKPLCRTKFNQFCITYRAAHLWNKIILPNFGLPLTYSVFKIKLKDLILSIENILEYF